MGINEESVKAGALPTKPTVWSKMKNFLFYEIKVELTPGQQEFENRLNDVLYQDVTFEKVRDFFLQEVTFGKKA